MQAFKRPPGSIAIEVTTRCNLACKMCSVWKQRKEGLAHNKVLSLMREARALGATRFLVCGTEPFVREDTVEILSYAELIGYREISTVSNGVLLNEGRIINELEKLGNLNIVVSLDGPREVHDDLRGRGVYDRAVEALREMRRRGMTCSISSVIMRQTVDHLKEIIDLAAELGIPVISMQPYNRETSGMDKDHAAFEFSPEEEKALRKKLKNLVLYAKAKKITIYTANMIDHVPPYLTRRIRPIPPDGCHVPSRLLLVDISGETYPCFMMRVRMNENSMGNVQEQTLDEIWHNENHRRLITLGISRKCPRCFAACGDVEGYNAAAGRGSFVSLMRSAIRRLI